MESLFDGKTLLTKDQQRDIRRFLKAGEYDIYSFHWPGGPVLGGQQANLAMRAALVEEVQKRTNGLPRPQLPSVSLVPFVRRKVQPMVRGLFPRHEQEVILTMLERSVVFLTPGNIEQVLLNTPELSTIWNLANLYLGSLNADLLGNGACRLLGLSEETTCYVSLEYFGCKDRFADFVVHEAAHVFHNCKRETIGLPETRTREFLLNIDFVQRETFAYACEAYSRILELGHTREQRLQLVSELKDDSPPPDNRVNVDKYHVVLTSAACSRNGWKRILELCSPPKRLKATV